MISTPMLKWIAPCSTLLGRWPLALAMVLPLAQVMAGSARAEFKVCNQTIELYNLAIGAERGGKFHTEGWWTLPANSCVTPIKEDLDSLRLKYVYVHATTVTGDSAFEGNWEMCVDTRRFEIEKVPDQPWNCWVRGFQVAKFKEIDTGAAKAWTVFIRGSK
jgi:uncharacterized membrane protein